MDDFSQLDGSDAPSGASTQAQLGSALKEHLKSALLILDALDQPSFANISADKEYKDSVQRLLSPLTTLPLSTVVDQANRVLRSGLDAISAQMSAIVDSPRRHPAAQPTNTQGATHQQTTRSTIPISRQNPTSEPQRAPGQPIAPPRPLPVLNPQLSPLAALKNDTSKAQELMLSIHFLAGFCKSDTNMEVLVYSVNSAIRPYPPSEVGNPTMVAEARTTIGGDRIVLGVVPGTTPMSDFTNMVQELNLSAFWYHGSVTRVRRGGVVEYIVRIKNVPQHIVGIYTAELVHQTEQYLAATWRQAIKLTQKISPLVYLCEGPKFALDRFSAAPKGSFDLVVDIVPGRSRKTIPGITVEGLCLSDVFYFV